MTLFELSFVICCNSIGGILSIVHPTLTLNLEAQPVRTGRPATINELLYQKMVCNLLGKKLKFEVEGS